MNVGNLSILLYGLKIGNFKELSSLHVEHIFLTTNMHSENVRFHWIGLT
jgi:hypothetical protein